MRTKYGHLAHREVLNAYRLNTDSLYMLQYAVAAAKGYTPDEIFSGNYEKSPLLFRTFHNPAGYNGNTITVVVSEDRTVEIHNTMVTSTSLELFKFVEKEEGFPSDDLVATILLLEKSVKTG